MTGPSILRSIVLGISLVLCGCGPQSANSKGNAPAKMDPYLSELFARPDDFQLVDKVFVRIAQQCDGSDSASLEALPREQKVVLDVWGSGGIIGNGGFQYLFESDLVDMPGIAASYDTIGVPRAAEAFRKAMAIFPRSKPHADVEKRLAYLEKLGPETASKLEQLSEEIWDCDRDIKRKLAQYVRANQTAFANLPPTQWDDIKELKVRDLAPPAADANEEEVIRWLQSIEVSVQRWDDGYYQVRDTTPVPDGNPIISLRLSRHRNSTDADLECMARCNALQRVREIKLAESYISARGMASLPKFPDLRLLSLENTDVGKDDLLIVASLPRLESLDLAKTRIANEDLRRIAGMSSLTHIDLSETPIDDRGLEHLASLPRLKSVELRDTRIQGSGLRALARSPLERLALMRSAVTDEGMRSLADMKHLKNLDLRDTAIGDNTLAHLNGRELEILDFSSTKITDKGLVHLARLPNVKSLVLEVTAIKGPGLKHLESLAHLEDLHLYKTLCDDEGIQHLSNVKPLKTLWMGETRVTDACLPSLSQLPKLEKLGLDEPGIQGGPNIRRLEDLKSLTWLSLPKHLKGNPNVRYLQKKMPQTEFSF